MANRGPRSLRHRAAVRVLLQLCVRDRPTDQGAAVRMRRRLAATRYLSEFVLMSLVLLDHVALVAETVAPLEDLRIARAQVLHLY